MKKILILFICFGEISCLFLLPEKSLAQDTAYNKNSFFVEPIVNLGKIVKNYPAFPMNNFCLLNELNIGWQTLGRKPWHHIYGFPQLGIAFIYSYQGNDVVLGRTFSIMPNFSVHAYRSGKQDVELRIGSGLAYFPIIYDAVSNTTNTLIGSKITAAPSFSLNYRITVSKKLQYKLGISTFHFSNGHVQLPNVGLNSVVVTTGLKYFPNGLNTLPEQKKIAKEKQPILLNVRIGLGSHEFGSELGPVGGPKYKILTTSVYASQRMGDISNVHIGFIDKYYSNYYEYIVDSNVYSKNQHLKANTFIFMLGHELMCGRISLLTQGGINMYNPFYKYYNRKGKNDFFKFSETWFCSRLGFQYYFFKPTTARRFNIYTGIYINANLGKADFDEVSVGFSF
jgi:hypothetical protein